MWMAFVFEAALLTSRWKHRYILYRYSATARTDQYDWRTSIQSAWQTRRLLVSRSISFTIRMATGRLPVDLQKKVYAFDIPPVLPVRGCKFYITMEFQKSASQDIYIHVLDLLTCWVSSIPSSSSSSCTWFKLDEVSWWIVCGLHSRHLLLSQHIYISPVGWQQRVTW